MNRHFDKDTGRMAQIGLTQQVELRSNWPTARTRGLCGGSGHKKMLQAKMGDEAGRELFNGGQLNPAWVCWLMQWPINWTSLEPLGEMVWLDWSVDPADMGAPDTWPTHKSSNVGMTAICSDRPPEKSTHLQMQVHLRGRESCGPIPRVAVGVKDRVNRLKALGNGQVPACVAAAWRLLGGPIG